MVEKTDFLDDLGDRVIRKIKRGQENANHDQKPFRWHRLRSRLDGVYRAGQCLCMRRRLRRALLHSFLLTASPLTIQPSGQTDADDHHTPRKAAPCIKATMQMNEKGVPAQAYTPDGRWEAEVPCSGIAVTVGIRPDHLHHTCDDLPRSVASSWTGLTDGALLFQACHLVSQMPLVPLEVFGSPGAHCTSRREGAER